MKLLISCILISCFCLHVHAEETRPLGDAIKELRKTIKEEGSFNYTIVWNDPFPYQVYLIFTKEEEPKEHLIITELPIKKTISPEDLSVGVNPFEAPKGKGIESTRRHLETTSQFFLDEDLTDRTYIHIYLLSISISDLEAHYMKGVNQAGDDNSE